MTSLHCQILHSHQCSDSQDLFSSVSFWSFF